MRKKNLFLLILSLIFCNTYIVLAQKQIGIASYYADRFEGKLTASGEKYRHKKLTAAHKILPFGTVVKVTNKANGRSVVVTINDRGPYIKDRVIDLSRAAAETLQFMAQGLAEVEIEVVDAGDGKVKNTQIPQENTLEEDTYFSLEVNLEKPDGFGVQIATFKSLNNLMRLSENIKKSYGEIPIIEVKDLNGDKVYAIIIGSTNNRKKAEQLKIKVQERFPGAFIHTF